MPITVYMPALSPTMEEGTLAQWLVSEGDEVSAGDILAEVETDKATMELEATEDGTVGKLLVGDDTEGIKVKSPIAVLLEEGEDESALDDYDVGDGGAKADSGAGDKAEKDEAKEESGDDESGGEKRAAKDSEDGEEDDRESARESDGGDSDEDEDATTSPAALAREPDVPEDTEFEEQSVRIALRDAMAEEMRRDDKVFLIGEEVAEYQGAYKVSEGLLDEFGDKRVIDTPITEHGFAGLGIGAAFAGLRPIVEFMTFNFAMQAMDQLINSAAKQRYMGGGAIECPIVFRGPNGFAARVAAQHSQCYASWYAHIPGLKVIAPYSAADAKGLLKAAVRDNDPVIFLEHELLYGKEFDVPRLDDYTVPIGKAKVVREGSDVTLISFSFTMIQTLEAAEKLADEGIEAEVIDLRTLRPLDTDTLIESIKKTNRAVSIEQGWPYASVSSEIGFVMMSRAFDYLDAPIARVTGADVPMPYAANLEKMATVQPDDIVKAAKQVAYKD